MLRALRDARTLVDALAAAPPEAPFVTRWVPNSRPATRTLTFGEFRARAREFATLYIRHSVPPGGRVVLIMSQDVDVMAAFAGAMLAGVIPAILPTPTFKVDPEKYRHGLRGVTGNLAASLVVLGEAFPDDLRAYIAAGDARVVGADEADASSGFVPAAPVAPGDVAFIQHSAGTTGLQKGVALSHRAVLNQLRHLADALRLAETDRIVSWLPLYHDMGLIACFILPMTAHLPVVMQSPSDWVVRPGTMLRLATEHRATLAWQPNFAFQFLARRTSAAERDALDLRSLRAIVNCSEPVRRESVEEFERVFRPHGLRPGVVHSSYAMAETTFAITQSGVGTAHPPRTVDIDAAAFARDGIARIVPGGEPGARTMVSSGTCLETAEVRIVAASGAVLDDGRLGEILVRSDSLFDGYYNRPDLTARAFLDGWYRTGDVGFRLDGELFVVGRRDDTIIVGGKNVYPQDVEEAVAAHPRVRDGRAVAFGIDNPELGTQDLVVLAEAATDDDMAWVADTEADLRRRVVGAIGIAPRFVRVVPPRWMVKSTAGKPARSTNRERFLRQFLDTGNTTGRVLSHQASRGVRPAREPG